MSLQVAATLFSTPSRKVRLNTRSRLAGHCAQFREADLVASKRRRAKLAGKSPRRP